MNIKLFILLFLIASAIILLISMCNKETFTDLVEKKYEIPTVKRPYVNLFDNNGNKLNIILLSKPFQTEHEMSIYNENKDKCIFIGISSYLEFPNHPSNPHEEFGDNFQKFKYKEICEGWIHGFRNPDNYFPPDTPLLFASESDFIDCNVSKPDDTQEKIYDFIYICLKVDDKKEACDDWATYNKNWSLAKKCLDIFCNKYKLKGLLIGRKGCELPNGCNYMETTNMLPYYEFQKMYSKAKFIFVPNEKDASPRVLTEALANNLSCLVNSNILGGWKYVGEETGELFTDENDVSAAVDKLLEGIKNNQYKPRDYFIKNYSVENSGKRLKEFVYKHWGDRINIPKDQVEFISPEFSKKDFKTCKV
jgi:hypothetical protein